MNLNYMVSISMGVKQATYFKLMLFYGCGELSYIHTATFGVN